MVWVEKERTGPVRSRLSNDLYNGIEFLSTITSKKNCETTDDLIQKCAEAIE